MTRLLDLDKPIEDLDGNPAQVVAPTFLSAKGACLGVVIERKGRHVFKLHWPDGTCVHPATDHTNLRNTELPAKVDARVLYAEDENGQPTTPIACRTPAALIDAARLLAMPATGHDRRSEFFWLRLQNGDLLLGTYPQGDTYIEFSDRGVCDWTAP